MASKIKKKIKEWSEKREIKKLEAEQTQLRETMGKFDPFIAEVWDRIKHNHWTTERIGQDPWVRDMAIIRAMNMKFPLSINLFNNFVLDIDSYANMEQKVKNLDKKLSELRGVVASKTLLDVYMPYVEALVVEGINVDAREGWERMEVLWDPNRLYLALKKEDLETMEIPRSVLVGTVKKNFEELENIKARGDFQAFVRFMASPILTGNIPGRIVETPVKLGIERDPEAPASTFSEEIGPFQWKLVFTSDVLEIIRRRKNERERAFNRDSGPPP